MERIGFFSTNTVVAPSFNAESLFTSPVVTKQGAFYDPSDLSTLWQDAAGTVPVTKSGDPVGLMKDNSGNNNHAVQTESASRPTYQTDGILHWLETDGVDDFFDTVGLVPYNGGKFFISTAAAITGGLVYAGLFRFLREGGLATATSDNFLEEYGKAQSKVVVQRYPNYSVFYEISTLSRASGSNYVSWHSNSATGAKTQVIPAQPNPINLGVKTLASGNATLSLFRGYKGDLMAGRFYGFIWLSDEITDEARDSANAYLAIKSGVTL